MNKKNILYVGSQGTSGYAIATKNHIFNYLMHGYNVTYIPLNVDNSKKHDVDIITNSANECINKKYEYYDFFILNFIPDKFNYVLNYENKIIFPDLLEKIKTPTCKKIIKTVWETTNIPTDWVSCLNDSYVDEIWLPSEFNKKVFQECGVIKPIKIDKYFSYNFLINQDKNNCIIPRHHKYGNSDFLNTFNFYYIATWNDRKNNLNTIKTFCETFSSNQNVSLLMKTNHYDYSPELELSIKNELEQLLKKYPDHPTIIWFPDNYSTEEISMIHCLGDCYFLLHRGEGLGYASYDAYLNNKPVIVTGYGGHVEYFSDKYPYFVDYSMIKVNGMKSTGFYQHDHYWAEPNYEHAKEILNYIYEKYK